MSYNGGGGRRLGDEGLEIRVLGEIAVVRGGRALPLPASKKTRALLGFLVATGTPHLRERLCELLWDGPDDPRAALRWSLSKLRPLVDEEQLVADRERVAFVGGGVDVDLHALRAALADDAGIDELRRAAERASGELLDGLDLPDCFRFHAWCAAEREAVRAQRIKLFATLVARLGADAPDEALKWARARLAADPLSDVAHAAVMRCLGALGRTRDAIAHFDDARRLLAAELGTRPTPELTRARDELGRPAPPPAAATAIVAAPAPAREAASSPREAASSPRRFVGRNRERAMLSALVDAAAAGQARELLLVVGEPGIGKSHLLDELATAMRAAGGLVLGGRAFEAEMVRPYGAWVDALRALDSREIPPPLRSELAPLLPELGAVAPASDRTRLYDAVVALLAQLARAGRPLALVLDDVHWLDESSAALLHYVARAATGGHLVVAAGARPGGLADHRAVLQVVRALARDGRLTRIELGPLDAGAIAELVGADDSARVFADSGGNPLFALELAAAGAEAGDTLDELLRDRLDRLGGRARDLLPFAAALGRSFSVELLAGASALPPTDLVAAVEELERHGVLRAGAAGSYDFAHDLVRGAAYRQMSEPRRRLVHQHIADVLGRAADADGALAGDRAHHAAVAGDFPTAARACLAAGERCLRMFAQAEAEKMAARGLSYLPHVSTDVRLALEIPLHHVAVYGDNARAATRELEGQLSRAVMQAEAAGLTDLAQHGFHLLAMLQWRADSLSRAESWTLLSAEKARTADPATAAKGLATTSRCLALIGREMPRAVAMALEADAIAREHDLDIPEVPWALGMAYHFSGDPDRARDAHQRALLLAARDQDHWGECMCNIDVAMLALEERQFEDARERCRIIAPVAAKLGSGSEAPFGEALAALAAYGLDEPDAAAAVERAIAALRDIDAKSLHAWVRNAAAEIDLAAGRAARALAHAVEARQAALAVDRPGDVALADALAARAAAGAGDAAEAARLAESLAAVDPGLLSARARRHVAAALAHKRSRA